MSGWDIEPGGVKRVLTKVETHASDLGTASGDVATHIESCAQAVGSSIVTKALSDFATARTPELTALAKRMNSAMTGTVNATLDYMKGSLDMAANAQRAATGKHG